MRKSTVLAMIGLIGATYPVAAANADVLVNIRPVVLQSASGLDTAMENPPTSDATVGVLAPFVVELWAQQAVVNPNYFGLGCVYSDLIYDNGFMTCAGVTAGPAFDNILFSGVCDQANGLVDEIGGCTFEFPGPGITPEWVRVATVNLSADAVATGNTISAAAAASPISLFFDPVLVSQVDFGPPLIVDIVPPTLTLNPDATCYPAGAGSTVTVAVDMTEAAATVIGGQFFLQYDPAVLDFTGIATGAAPFTLEIFQNIDEIAGTIDYSVGIPLGGTGTAVDSTMAVLTFTALSEICSTADLVAFRPHDPPTRLSAVGGAELAPNMDHLAAINIDGTAPLISDCPTDVAVSNDVGLCSASVSWTAPTASDNCTVQSFEASHHPGDSFPIGDTLVTYTAADECGHTASCSFTVSVSDDELPTIACPTDLAVSADPGVCVASGLDLGLPTTTDNCGVSGVVNDAPAEFAVGTTTVTWTVTDVHGNTNTCTQNVAVTDDELPTIDCPADVSVSADAGLCSASGVELGQPTTADNCGVSGVVNDAPAVFAIGATTVTWTVTDVNGNTNTCTQSVTVTDDELPTIVCPADITVPTDPGVCAASGLDLGTPATSDNCGVSSVVHDAPTDFAVGTTTVTWTVTDVHGNTNTCTQSITITEDEPPTITCPADVAVSTDPGTCSAASVDLGTPATSDNCDVADVVNDAPAEFLVGTTPVTWTVTDANNNTNTCIQMVTVTDDEPPTIICPADLIVPADPGVCTASGLDLGTPSSSDNCGVDSVINDAPAVFAAGATIVTWTVIDVHGNLNTCTQTVTVNDDQPPTITCPADISINADPGFCTASGVNLGSPAMSDNCGIAGVVNDAPTDFPLGATLVTWTVTDVNGNTDFCTQTVTVTETEVPVISGCPANITVNADGGGCDAAVMWTEPTAADNCGVPTLTSTHTPGDIFPEGTTTVTYTAEDASGNTSDCSFDVTVIGVNELVASVRLAPTVAMPLSRCITFELWECGQDPVVVNQEITFVGASSSATIAIDIPCGAYDCITVRDELHTLRRTLNRSVGGDFDVVGNQYVADFVSAGKPLVGGNLNDDFWVDILDYGVFSSQWGVNYGTGNTTCAPPFPHADISGDGLVSIHDFSFIQIYFAQGSEPNCCGAANLLDLDDGPITRISTEELQALGLSELSAGDLNDDGWLDQDDIEAFLSGKRPNHGGRITPNSNHGRSQGESRAIERRP